MAPKHPTSPFPRPQPSPAVGAAEMIRRINADAAERQRRADAARKYPGDAARQAQEVDIKRREARYIEQTKPRPIPVAPYNPAIVAPPYGTAGYKSPLL